MTAPLAFASLHPFRSRLGDADFWWPSVAEILERHDPVDAGRESVAGSNATCLTFLDGDATVKLFGYARSRRGSRAAQRPARALLAIGRFLHADASFASRRGFAPVQGGAHARRQNAG